MENIKSKLLSICMAERIYVCLVIFHSVEFNFSVGFVFCFVFV